ncbi:MAG TPA: hypothetical protein VEQ10_15600 [Vicinamibacteria bacterium]|nr:hypothetical protein [Vicinamibacteria bacterium]
MRAPAFLGVVLALGFAPLVFAHARAVRPGAPPSDAEVVSAFASQGIRLTPAEAGAIRGEVRLALEEACAHGIGDSKVDFAAVEIANRLGLEMAPGSATVRNVVAAIRWLLDHGASPVPVRPDGPPSVPPPLPPPDWCRYFERTLSLWNDGSFMSLVREKGFSPVKISWEDIGRYAGSVWGDRISDVGIWVRENEADPASARLALSVRHDSNFRDRVLVVPASAIKVHQRLGEQTVEKTLPQRLAELGLRSASRDRHVIVSNQFAIVPVPAHGMQGAWPQGEPPRAAFTFSIFPYGSTNFVITDVIEGSHEAVVGPGQHQLLFANVEGRKAPFTASRAEDRQDLLHLERELRAQGMDVDVQRYYLIQVPLRRDVASVQLSNMGTPPWRRGALFAAPVAAPEGALVYEQSAPAAAGMNAAPKDAMKSRRADSGTAGFERVAIGHGESEGPYFAGAGYASARAEEPIRVTVVYFVTPVGEVTRRDMEGFAAAFARWDAQAIWGGSFVTKETF